MEAHEIYERATKEARKKKPDNGKVYALLEQAHEQGDARATYALADWHVRGFFVKKQVKKGVQYYKMAAKKLNADALCNLGIAYEKGWGVKKSDKKAFRCYLAAAVQEGECTGKEALLEVCRCFYYGVGVKKNKKLAKLLRSICDFYGIDFEEERLKK